MKMQEVRQKARGLGIRVKNMPKAELIRTIQRSEGYFACFGTARDHCDQRECCFYQDCLGLNR